MSDYAEIKAADAAASQRPLAWRLEQGIAAKLVPVYADLRDEVLAYAEFRGDVSNAHRHAEVLANFCERQAEQIAALQKAERAFQSRFSHALDEAEKRAAILEFVRNLGGDGRQVRRDSDALDKFFDADAATERFTRRIGERERALAYALDRLGRVAGEAVQEDPNLVDSEFLVDLFENLLGTFRIWRGDARIRRAAHSCARQVASALFMLPDGAWLDSVLSATRRVCLDDNEDVWVQCEAIDALLALSPRSLPAVITRRLAGDIEKKSAQLRDNEMFVRRHLVRLICRHAGEMPRLVVFIPQLANDRNGAVRQALADALHLLPAERAAGVAKRMRTDPDPQVRAALFADPARIMSRIDPQSFVRHLCRIFLFEEDEFVLRVAFDAAALAVAHLAGTADENLAELAIELRAGIDGLRRRGLAARLMRWADEARERIWFCCDPAALEIAEILRCATTGQREGTIRRAKGLRQWLKQDPEKVGRVMAVIAQREFGLSVEPGMTPRILRGECLKRRMWRIMYEWRNSATDKRQAHRHTTGRHFYGSMIAPSARMAELAPTKVPGEPQFESREGGWRNYLPLVDQVLSAIDRGGKVETFTSAGITELMAPEGIFARTRAFWKISNDFARFAALRNREPEHFLVELRAMGVAISFRPYRDEDEPNPEVTRLFSYGGAVAALPVLLDRAVAYASTVYENNLLELGIFLGCAGLWFFGKHALLGWQARRLRSNLSLVLGGWGTRGKSGTERLKAGLVNALGPSIVSKTTGCEAMFLMGTPFGGLTEMFLFRPYDKATIWEQFNLLKTAKGLDARVLLWECMGLNPSYVRVLQQDWMRDDIGTITNTYPDHEDVQGPAGRNIPEVMCEFIPRASTLLTTEEEMLPILQQGAELADTRMRSIGWKEAGLIHRNLLKRFPYEEHPYNIALVTAMGDELGLEPDFCVREMADRVVADLGVLKTYPRSLINGRTLEFVMGMSANERFGAMGNWSRMGFAEHDLARDPDVFVTTIVNNRADRVPRSRVFARMLVHDVAADKHFLIGSNIEGLIGFINEEWDQYSSALTLGEDGADPVERLEELAKFQRIAVCAAELEGVLAAMLAPQSAKIDIQDALKAAREGRLAEELETAGVQDRASILAHYQSVLDLHREFSALKQAVMAGGGARHDAAMRALLGKAFQAKLVPVRDYYMKGEKIVRLVADNIPPGLLGRIMGMQNIKGTGLDWVYRWQAWEAVWKACQQLREEDPFAVERGFRMLAGFQEYGVLSEREVHGALNDLRSRIGQFPTITNAQIDAIAERLEQQLRQHDSSAPSEGAGAGQESGWIAAAGQMLMKCAEAFLDGGDAVRRRRSADRVYAALIAEQISTQRAVAELKELTARQKGGWLNKAVKDKTGKLLGMRRAA